MDALNSRVTVAEERISEFKDEMQKFSRQQWKMEKYPQINQGQKENYGMNSRGTTYKSLRGTGR